MAKMKVSLRRSIIFYITAFVLIAMMLSASTPIFTRILSQIVMFKILLILCVIV